MYNHAVMMGRICNDLELKTTPSGVSVLSFRIATDREYQVKGEERKSDFFNVVAWRNEADFISRWFSKGKMILVEGELQNRSYTDKNKIERQVTELIVSRACFTGEKTDGGGGSYRDVPPPPEPPRYANSAGSPASGSTGKQYTAEDFAKKENEDDDYPF